MKSLKPFISAITLCALPAFFYAPSVRADITTVTHMTLDMPMMHTDQFKNNPAIQAMLDKNSNTTTYMTVHKTRVDNAMITMIMDMDASKMIMLNPASHTYTTTVLNPQDFKTMLQTMTKNPTTGANGATDYQVVDTGKTTTILGHTAHHYTFSMTMTIGGTSPMHITGDILAAEDLAVPMNDAYAKLAAAQKIKGLPLVTDMKMTGGPTGGMTMKLVVTSVSTDPIPDSRFAIPQGYTETKAPAGSGLSGILGH